MAILIAPERPRDLRIAELRWGLRQNERKRPLLVTSHLLEKRPRAQQKKTDLFGAAFVATWPVRHPHERAADERPCWL